MTNEELRAVAVCVFTAMRETELAKQVEKIDVSSSTCKSLLGYVLGALEALGNPAAAESFYNLAATAPKADKAPEQEERYIPTKQVQLGVRVSPEIKDGISEYARTNNVSEGRVVEKAFAALRGMNGAHA